VIPIWTLAVAAVAGLAVGVLVGRLVPRPRASAEPVTRAPSTAPPVQATAPPAEEEAPLAPGAASTAAEPVRAEAPRIDMGDVVSELERRYEGRRAEEGDEKERRRRDRPQPSE
jgi:hypothetical protein